MTARSVGITVMTPAPRASAATTAVVRTTEVGGAEAVDRTAEREGAEPTVVLDDLVANGAEAVGTTVDEVIYLWDCC